VGPSVSALSFDFVNDPPFSFRYGGVSSHSLLAGWSPSSSTVALDAVRTQQTVTWTGTSGLVVRCVAVTYADFPVVEWTVHFENTGGSNTPTLSEVLAIDTLLQGAATSSWTIHTNNGSIAQATDFAPADLTLSSTPGQYKLFSAGGGRPTSGHLSGDPLSPGGAWPYYNFDWGGAGAIVAIGWPGQWGLQTGLDTLGRAPIIGGMTNYDGLGGTTTLYHLQLTEMYLEPGEAIRTPLIVTMAWQGGDWIDAQNVWRQWFLTHNTPHPNGTNPPAMCPTGSVCGSYNYVNVTTEREFAFMDEYRRQGLLPSVGGHLDWWWIDAGWYTLPAEVDPHSVTAWQYTGIWQVDRERYPGGLKEVTDRARAEGMRAIVWHEVERCRPGTWLYDNHPEWMLADGDPQHRYLNWGNPDAHAWALDTVVGLIEANGADLYRQDFNYLGPLANWNATDRAGRRGATQIHYVVGLLRFLDELRRRWPDMLIDNCASGGRRLDVEMLRRSIVLSQSDDVRDPEGSHSQYFGISPWIVCHGTSARTDSMYALRSTMNWCFEIHVDDMLTSPPTDERWGLLRRATTEWAAVRDHYSECFFPLSGYDPDMVDWLAYQYGSASGSVGVLHAFARPGTPSGGFVLRPRGLRPDITYAVADFDGGDVRRVSGLNLMSDGVVVEVDQRPAAVMLRYEALSTSEDKRLDNRSIYPMG
jgi:alpha-galactosidase